MPFPLSTTIAECQIVLSSHTKIRKLSSFWITINVSSSISFKDPLRPGQLYYCQMLVSFAITKQTRQATVVPDHAAKKKCVKQHLLQSCSYQHPCPAPPLLKRCYHKANIESYLVVDHEKCGKLHLLERGTCKH